MGIAASPPYCQFAEGSAACDTVDASDQVTSATASSTTSETKTRKHHKAAHRAK